MTVLTTSSGGRTNDAAVLAEELAEIHSTPTPKGWLFLQQLGLDIYTQNLRMTPI